MYTSSHIRRFINNLSTDSIFATRELLRFGKRSAVDRCLSRLVKRGDIIRLTRGIFKRFDNNILPSNFAVANAKAKAFAKHIFRHPYNSAKSLGLIDHSNEYKPIYVIVGHSSKFRFGKTVIEFKGMSSRKICLGDSLAGSAAQVLWYLGKSNCNKQSMMTATTEFNRQQRQELRQLAHLVPGWLSDKLHCS